MVNWFVYVEADVSGYAWFMEKKDQNVVFELNIGVLCIGVGTGLATDKEAAIARVYFDSEFS